MVKRILFVNVFDTLQGDVNGFLAAFCNLDSERFECIALSNPRGGVYERLRETDRVRIICHEMGGESGDGSRSSIRNRHLFVKATLRAARLIRRDRIDVVHAVDRSRGALIALLAARLTGRPLVLSANSPFYGATRTSRAVLRGAQYIHAPSDHLATLLRRRVNDPTRVNVVPYGVALHRYSTILDGSAARRELGVPVANPLVLLPGRMVAYKGHLDLVQAAVHVHKRLPDAWFVFVGPDSDDFVPSAEQAARLPFAPSWAVGDSFAEVLSTYARQCGVDHRVVIRGAWPWRDFPALLAAADVVAMPSWGEVFGLVALEGMAMGKPILSTRVDGIPEFVIDEEVGLLVSILDPPALADALIRVLSDQREASEMGRRGRRRVELRYTVERYARDIEAILDAAADGRRPTMPAATTSLVH